MLEKLGSERYSVQNTIIQYVRENAAEYTTSKGENVFIQLGWEYISPDDALKLRNGKTGLVFKDIFIQQIIKLNPFVTEKLANELIKQLERIPPNIQGNFIAWEYLKGLRTIFIPEEKRE